VVTTEDIIGDVLAREGGYVDDPIDRGGCTRFGITLKTLAAWRKNPWTSCADVEALTEVEARNIYRRMYIEAPGYDLIPNERLRALVVDYAVLSGPHTATKALQRALGIADDGVLGAQTRRLLGTQGGSPDVYRALLADRIAHHVEIVLLNPSQRRFLKGWLSRLTSFL
jgi:lysozyme family protein